MWFNYCSCQYAQSGSRILLWWRQRPSGTFNVKLVFFSLFTARVLPRGVETQQSKHCFTSISAVVIILLGLSRSGKRRPHHTKHPLDALFWDSCASAVCHTSTLFSLREVNHNHTINGTEQPNSLIRLRNSFSQHRFPSRSVGYFYDTLQCFTKLNTTLRRAYQIPSASSTPRPGHSAEFEFSTVFCFSSSLDGSQLP